MKLPRLSRQEQIELLEMIEVVGVGIVAGGALSGFSPSLIFWTGIALGVTKARKRQLERRFKRARAKVPPPPTKEQP